MDESSLNNQQKIQEALNQAKKAELEQKYGARFSELSKLPPEVEEQWLNNIEEFERQFRNSRDITVREFLGSPAFPLMEDLPAGSLEEEISNVLDFLDFNDIAVDCLAEVADEDFYRFLTTELMEAEISDVRMPGWTHRYIYEEFHPNDEYDAKSSAEYFLAGLFARGNEEAMQHLSKDEGVGAIARREVLQLKNDIQSFYSRFASFPHHEFECTDCRLEGEYAMVTLHVKWTGLRSTALEVASFDGIAEIRLRKSPYGMYDVLQARIPGFPEGM